MPLHKMEGDALENGHLFLPYNVTGRRWGCSMEMQLTMPSLLQGMSTSVQLFMAMQPAELPENPHVIYHDKGKGEEF